MENKNPVIVPFVCGMLLGALILGLMTHLMVDDLQTMVMTQHKDIDDEFRSFITIQRDSLESKKKVNHKLDLLKAELNSVENLLMLNLLVPKEKHSVYNMAFITLSGREWLNVTATAYTNSVDETDSTPNITATGKQVSPKYIACSGDIIEQWGYGTKVILAAKTVSGELLQFGEYEIQDIMNERYTNSCDVFMWSKKEALQFGRRKHMRLIKI